MGGVTTVLEATVHPLLYNHTVIYFQTDPKYKKIKLGNGSGSIFDYGCNLVSHCNGLNKLGYSFTPETLNDLFIEKGIYGGDSRNLIIPGRLPKNIPEIYLSYRSIDPYNDLPGWKEIPENLIICRVDARGIGGSGTHFVDFDHNIGKLAMVIDPWFGTIDPVTLHYNRYNNILGLRIFNVKKKELAIEENMTDQTKIELGDNWGSMELQAVRSTLNDLKRDKESAELKVAQLEQSLSTCKTDLKIEADANAAHESASREQYNSFIKSISSSLGSTQDEPRILQEVARLKAVEDLYNDQQKKINDLFLKVDETVKTNEDLKQQFKVVKDQLNQMSDDMSLFIKSVGKLGYKADDLQGVLEALRQPVATKKTSLIELIRRLLGRK